MITRIQILQLLSMVNASALRGGFLCKVENKTPPLNSGVRVIPEMIAKTSKQIFSSVRHE